MGQINMPPGGLAEMKLNFATYCQEFEDDPLYINVKAEGEFLCRPLGDFKPDLPEGCVTPKKLGPFVPVHNNKDVVMIYRDIASNNVYVLLIEIRRGKS